VFARLTKAFGGKRFLRGLASTASGVAALALGPVNLCGGSGYHIAARPNGRSTGCY